MIVVLFLKRVKRRLSRIYHNFKMTHGHVNVVHLGLGSYKKYIGGGNNMIVIKKNCVIDNPVFHIVGNNNKITFEENCHVGPDCSFWMEGNNVQITIGRHTTFTNSVHVNAQEDNMKIEIGEDCMFSNHIIIRTSDSHAIYSNDTNKRINPAKSIKIGKPCMDSTWFRSDERCCCWRRMHNWFTNNGDKRCSCQLLSCWETSTSGKRKYTMDKGGCDIS